MDDDDSAPSNASENTGASNAMSSLLEAIDALRGEISRLRDEIRDCSEGGATPQPSGHGKPCDVQVLIEIERLRRDIYDWREREAQ